MGTTRPRGRPGTASSEQEPLGVAGSSVAARAVHSRFCSGAHRPVTGSIASHVSIDHACWYPCRDLQRLANTLVDRTATSPKHVYV